MNSLILLMVNVVNDSNESALGTLTINAPCRSMDVTLEKGFAK